MKLNLKLLAINLALSTIIYIGYELKYYDYFSALILSVIIGGLGGLFSAINSANKADNNENK